MERMTQLLERICNQNVHKDIISDFKVCSLSSWHPGTKLSVLWMHINGALCTCSNRGCFAFRCCDAPAEYCAAQLIACGLPALFKMSKAS